jgi:hypothetical protein
MLTKLLANSSAEDDEPLFIEKRPEFYSVQRFVCRHVRSSNAGRRRSNPLRVAVDQTNPFIHDVKKLTDTITCIRNCCVRVVAEPGWFCVLGPNLSTFGKI